MLQSKTLQQTANLESLGSSLQHFTPKAVDRLIELFRPLLPEGAPEPELESIFQLLLHLLIDSGSQVIASNWERHQESLTDLGLREDRNEAIETVRPKLFRIRDIFHGALGPKGPRLLALGEGVESTIAPLVQQTIYVYNRLLDPTLLEGLEPWIPLDPTKLAELIAPELARLRGATQGLAAEQRATEESLLALREVQAKSQRCYVHGAKIVEGFFRLVGMDAEADRIRRVHRRTTSTPDGVPLPEDTDSEDTSPENVTPEEVAEVDVGAEDAIVVVTSEETTPEEVVANEVASPEEPSEDATPDAPEPREG